MSFHGGAAGVIPATIRFARRRNLPILTLGEIVVCAAPIGLFLRRIANFINGELYGRASDVPWTMVFPHDELGLPRHASQLYEAALEGLVLFLLLYWLVRHGWLLCPSAISGAFLAGYGAARLFVELFRQPDGHLGFLIGPATMGQLLSVPMLLAGLALILWARRSGPAGP